MKRESRQHVMVRNYPIQLGQWNPRPTGRILNQLTSPPWQAISAGFLPGPPTNRSKFTRKCGWSNCLDCHLGGKSKGKTKGAYKKLSSCDTMSSYRLITWRVVDDAPGFKASGFSASRVLDYLGHDDCYGMDHHGDDNNEHESSPHEIVEVDDNDDGCGTDEMSFCEVGFVWEPVEDDS